MENETVTISKKEYDDLVRRNDMLSALEAGGVDNWTWYYESLQEYYKKYYPEDYEDEDESE